MCQTSGLPFYMEVIHLPLFLSLLPTGWNQSNHLDSKAEVCVGMAESQN